MVSSGSIHTIMEGKAFSYLCVLLAIVAGVCAGPLNVNEAVCAKECKVDQSTLQYEVGKTYVYNYEADTVSTLQGSFDEHSSIHVRASAEIEVLAPCELVLSLRDVTLENSDPHELSRLRTSDNQSAFKKALESRQLRFAFQNGRIESICAAEDEPQWSLNFKRGVLSALQNSMSHLEKDQKIKETDVAGECETDYKVSSNGWNSVTITKSKNLLGCTGRTNAITSLQSTPYTADSDIQSLPLMKSAHNCEQTVSKSGILQKSECHESHVFRPFSNKGSGAATTVRQVLTYNKEYNYVQTRNAPAHRRTTLTFEHNSEMDAEKNVERVTEKLQEICSSDDIRPQTPRLFSELVFAMKSLDIYNLQSVHNRVERSRICTTNHAMAKKFFHDALPAMGTSASVSLMQKLIVSGEVTGTEAGMWLTSLAFIAKPTKEMITEIKPLLDNVNAFLPISSMIHTFCKTTGDCEFEDEVRDVVRSLTDNLGYNCKGDHHKILMTLKALGNIGVSTGAIETIARCANEVNSIEVRVAAIDAYRRMSCDVSRAELETIFKNSEEDSEVRIAAYLGLMQCPTEYTISLVKNVLETEEVNQVGSFVWTHLTNIKESAGQFKQDTRDILEDETLKKTFNLDARKFSRNYEGSFFLESFNTGAMAEGNLIWSSKSFIPRSANLNLTVDLFGHSMNLFEFGGRIEGLESYLEAFFGPNGYFPDNAISDVLKRQRRASSNRLTSLFNQFNAQNDELKSSAFFRMFGNELKFFDSAKKQQKEEFNFLEFLIKLAQEHQMEYTKSFQFLDSELHMPTIIGVPLKLCINGTATVDVKVGGKMDVRKAGTSPHSLDINGYIKPSGAVEISGEMTVDATFARSGLKMVSTLHSSTELNGLIQLQESKILNVKFNMPKDQMEIIDVQTKFFVLNGEEHLEQEMKNTPRVQKKACTGNGIYNILGLQLCGEASYPDKTEKEDSPYFPFNGPINGGLTLYRRDLHTSYEFMAQIEAKKERVNGATGITNIVHFAFNTPGSNVNRELLFDFNLNSMTKELNAELRTPWKRASAKGSLETDGNIKRVNFNADMDGDEIVYLTGELQNEYLANGRRLIPSAELRIPGRKPLLFRGAVTSQPGKLYDAQVSIENVFSKDVLVKGSIEQQGSGERLRYNTEGEIQSPIFNSKGSGFIANKAGVMRSRIEVTYDFAAKKSHNIVFNGKYRDQSKKANMQYSASVAVQSTQFPDYQFEIDADFQKNGRHFENNFEMIFGADRKDNSKRIIFKQEANIDRADIFKMDHSMNLKIKPLNIIMSSRLDHTYGLNEMKTEGTFSYKPGKEISVNVGLKKETTDLAKINANLHLCLPSRELRLTSNLEETAKDSFNHEIAVQWQKNAQFRTVTTYTRVPVQRRHEIRTEIYPPGMDAVIVSGLAVLDPANFQTKMEAEIKRETYGTTISYVVDFDGKVKAIEANLDAICPSRHVTFETKIDGTDGRYRLKSSTKWDAGRDESKQVVISGQLNNIESATLRVNMPGRKITLNMKQQMTKNGLTAHGDLSWDRDSTISIDTDYSYKFGYYRKLLKGSFAITTPFQYMEQARLAIDHSHDRTGYTSSLETSLAPSKSISINAEGKTLDSWKEMENKLTITTPFEAAHTIGMTSTHKITNNEASGDFVFIYNTKNINIGFNAKNEALKDIQVTASLKSNLPNLADGKIELIHQISPSSLQSKISGELDGESVLITVNGKMNRDGKEGALSFSAPFCNDITVSGMIKNDGETYETNVEAAWAPTKKITFSSSISHNGYGMRFENNGNFVLHTPFNSVERLSGRWNHNINDGRIVSTNEVQWNAEKLTFSTDTSYSLGSTHDVASTSAFTSTSPALRNANLDIKYNAKPTSFQGTMKVSHNGANDITLSTDLAQENGRNFAGNVKVNSIHFGAFTSDVSLKTQSTPLSGHIETSWDNKKLRLDGEVTLIDMNNFKGEVRLVTPFRAMERVYVNLDHNKKDALFNTKTTVEYGSQKFSAETAIQVEEDIKIMVSLFTTYSGMRSMKYRLNHSGAGINFNGNTMFNLNEETNIQATYQLMGSSGSSFTFDVNGQQGIKFSHSYDGNAFDVSTEVMVNTDKKITITGKTSSDPALMTLSLKTPFNSLSSLEINGNIDGNANRFSSAYDISLTTLSGELKTTGKLRASGFSYVQLEASLNTPVQGYESLSIDVSHRYRRNGINSKITMSYPYSNTIELSSDINTLKGEGTMSLKTPFHDDIIASAGLSQNGFEANLEYARGKSINIQGSLEYDNKIIASGSIRSPCPWLKSVSGKFEHSGPWNAFTSQASFEYERFSGPIEATLSFNLENADLETAAMLTTPFDQVKEVSVRLTNKNPSWKRYDSSVSATYNKQTLFEGQTSMKFVHIGNFNGDINLSSILPEARSVVLSFKHKGEPTSFTQNAEFSLNGNKHVYSGTFNAANTIEGNFELNDRSLYFSHEGTLQNMRSNMKATYEAGKDITATASISVEDSIEGKLEFNAPFSEKLVATVSHTGSIDNFRHTSKLMYGRQTHSASMNVKVHPNVICQVKIETPLFEDVEVVLTHDGILKAFQSTGSVRYGSKTVEATTEVDVRSGLKVKVTMNTPFRHLEDIKFDLTHSGSVSPLSYSTVANIGFAPSQNIEISSNGHFDFSSIDAHLTFTSPFAMAKDGAFNLVFKTHGSLLNFNGDLDAAVNSKTIMTAHADMQSERQVAGNFRLTTPISGLESTAITFTHEGGLDSFKCNAVMSYAHGEMRGDIEFQQSPPSLKLSLRTPYYEVKDVTLKMGHTGNAYGFDNEMSFSHNIIGSFSYTGQLKVRRNINGEFTLHFPLAGIETTYARFSQVNEKTGFNNEAEVGSGSKILKSQAQLTWDKGLQGRLSLQTPFSQCEDFMLTLTQEGDISNFNAEMKIDLNRENKLETNAYLKTAEGVQAGANVITKFGTQSVSVTHTGSFSSKMSTAGILQYPGGKINIDLDLVTKPSVTGSLRIKSPFAYMRDMTISGKYKNNRRRLNIEATFDHNMVGKINGDFDLVVFPTVSCQMSLETPFEAARAASMKFSHASEGGRYQTEAEASYNNNIYSAIGKLNMDPMEGSIEINTPIESLREVKLDLSQEGSKTSAFMTYNRQQLFQADGTFTRNPMQASVIITTASDYLQSLELETSHSGTVHGMTSSGSLKYNGQKMISSDMNLRLIPDIEGTLQISTASPHFETFVGKIQHQGELKSFSSQAEINLNNRHQIEGAIDFSVNPLMGKVSLKTPYAGAREVVAAFNHQGKLKKFQSHAEFRFDYGNFESDVTFQSRPLKVTGSIKTPFEGARDLNAMLKHKGDMDSFTTHAEASCENGEWETDVSYQRQPLQANVELKTPFRGYRKMNAALTQNGNTAHMEVNIQQTKLEADGFLQLQPLNANIAIKTPYRGMQNMNAAIRHEGDLSSFSSQVEAGYENNKFLIGCAYSRQPLQGSFNLQTPFYGANNINLAFNQNGNNAHIEGSCDFGKIEADGSLQMDPLKAAVHIQTPFEGAKHLKGALSQQENGAHLEASYDFGKYEADGYFTRYPLQASLDVRTPHSGARNIKVNFNQRGSSAHVDASYDYGKYEADGSFTYSPLQGSLDIKTPHDGARNIKANFNQRDSSAHVDASYDYGKYEVDGSYSMRPLQGNLHIQTPHYGARNLKAAFTQEDNSAHADASYDFGQYSVDGTFTRQPLQGSIQVKTPHDGARNLRAALNHLGNSVHAEASSDDGKVEIDGSLSLAPVEASLTVKTPFQGYRNVYASISHVGNIQAMQTSAKAGCDRYNFEAAGKFRLQPLQGELTLKTPFNGANNVNLQFNHHSTSNGYNSNVEVSYDYGKYAVDSEVTVSPPKAQVSITTPHPGYENINAVLVHSADQNGYKTHAEASCGIKKMEADMVVEKYPLTARLSLRTPFTIVRDANIAFTHSGNQNSFETKAEANINDHKAEAVALFTSEPLHAKLSLKTPLNHLKDVQAAVSFEGDKDGFNVKANAGNENGKLDFVANVQNRPLNVKVTLQTPIRRYEEVGFELNHKGNLAKAFRSQASLQYQTGKTISASARYKNMRRMVGDVEIRSPFFKPLSASLRHDSSNDGVNSNVELSMGKKSMSGDIELRLSPSPSAKVQLKSPFSGMEEMSFGFDHKMGDSTIDTTTTITTPQGTASIAIKGQYSDIHNMQGMLTITSPLKDAAIQFTSRGTDGNLKYLAKFVYDSKTIIGELDVNTSEGLKMTGKLTTPIGGYEELAFSVEHQGSATEFKSSGSLTNGQKTITGNVQLQTDGQIMFNVNINTPFTAFSEGTFSINHSGNSRRFRTNVRTSINQEKPMILAINFANDRQLRVTIDADCPYAEDVSFTFSHTGLANSFTTEANIKNGRKESSIKITFQKNDGLNLNVEAISPYLERPIVFTVAHEGSLHQFNTRASFNNARAFATWRYMQGAVTGQVSFESPYSNKFEAEVKFNGDKANFETSGVLSYAGIKEVEGHMEYNSHNGLPTNIQVTFDNPFAETLALNIRSGITRGRYSLTGTLGLGQQKITFQGAGTFADTAERMQISGNMNIQTPFSAIRSIDLTVDHDHGSSRLNNKLSMKINEQKLIDTEVQYANNAGRLNIKEPHPASVSYELTGEKANFGINWNTASPSDNFRIELLNKDDSTYYQTSRSVSLRTISSSRTMVFSADLLKSETTFSHKANFAWDAKKAKEVSYQIEVNDKSRRSQHIYDALVSITTPIRSMELIGSHNDDSRTFSSSVTWKWDSARDESRRVTLTNTYQLVGSNQHTHEVIISHPALSKDITLRNVLTLKDEDIIFSGRSELSYSSDARENIVISSKLEGRNMNYSMSFDISNPINTIDISLAGHAASSDSRMSSGMKFRYMNSQREINNYNLFGEIQSVRKSIRILFSTPEKTRQLIADATPNAYGYSVMIAAKDNDQEIFKASSELNVEEKAFNIDANYHPDGAVHVNGRYNSPIDMKFEVYREEDGSQIPESNVQIDLKNQRLVHTRLYVRPGMSADIKATLASLFYRTKGQATRHLEIISSRLTAELRAKYNIISRNVPSTNSFEMFSDADIASMQQDTQVVYRAWRKMFYNDEFYMKTIYRSLGRTTRAITEWVEEMYSKIESCLAARITRMMEAVKGWFSEVADVIACHYNDLQIRFGVWYGSTHHIMLAEFNKFHQWAYNQTSVYRSIYNEHVHETVEEIIRILSSSIDAYTRCTQTILSWIESKFISALEYALDLLETIPYEKIEACVEAISYRTNQYKTLIRAVIQQQQKIFNSMMEKLGEYDLLRPIYNAHIKIVDKVESILVSFAELLDNPVSTFVEYIHSANQAMDKLANDALSSIKNEYLHGVAEQAIKNVRWVYRHYDLDAKLITLVKQTVASSVKMLKDNALYMVNDYLGLEQDRLMVYNPLGGELEFELYVPTDMPTFKFPISFEGANALYVSGKEAINNLHQNLPSIPEYNLWDLYYMYKPSSKPSSWIPPFEARASISGDQHIITFDKKFYNFAGGCDYVLASDFVDGNFTIIANYKNGKRTALTVVTNEQEIEISDVPKVNGEETELPYEYQTTTVIRSGDTIRLDSKLGFTVTCDIMQNFCSVNMSGWYFGKTAGLFGTYTNEVTDDFITADQKITNDVAEFAQSWAVGRCRDNTNYASAVSQIENSKCEAFFKSDDSSLRKCFKVIDPDDFYRMCLSDAHHQAGECSSAALYRLVCSQEGEVDVDMPTECSTCAKPVSGVMAIDEEMTITVPPQSADVVFVVEEKACNMDAATKLYSLATKIDLELHNKGLKNTRFGLVGYGGNGIHAKPHTHTVGGKMFEDARKLNSAFQSLKMQGNGESDTLGALSAAAEYPFRMGVSKSIILVTCGVCDDASVKYEDAAEILEDMDITLHVLSEYEFTMESQSQSPKTNYLFGIDAKTAYTVRHVSDSELIGDEDLFAQLSEPESQCADLAQETGGSFFNIKKLTEGRVRFQKSFVDIFSRRVAKNAVPASCQVCECQFSNSGVGQTVCVPCLENNPIKQMVLEDKLEAPEQVYVAEKKAKKQPRALRTRKNKKAKKVRKVRRQ